MCLWSTRKPFPKGILNSVRDYVCSVIVEWIPPTQHTHSQFFDFLPPKLEKHSSQPALSCSLLLPSKSVPSPLLPHTHSVADDENIPPGLLPASYSRRVTGQAAVFHGFMSIYLNFSPSSSVTQRIRIIDAPSKRDCSDRSRI